MNHGTRQGYSAHRRRGEKPCDSCRVAFNKYKNDRRRAGNAPTFTSAEPAFHHMMDLREKGHTIASMSTHSGVSVPTLDKIIADYTRNIRSDNAEKILAVPLDAPVLQTGTGPRSFIENARTREHLQALKAAGHTVYSIHAHTRVAERVLAAIIRGETKRTRRSVEERVLAVPLDAEILTNGDVEPRPEKQHGEHFAERQADLRELAGIDAYIRANKHDPKKLFAIRAQVARREQIKNQLRKAA